MAAPTGYEGGDGRTVGQVEHFGIDVGVAGGLANVPGDAFAGFEIADREGDCRADVGEDAGGLDADARGATGDDRTFSGQVDARDNVGSGGVEIKSCRERSHK